MKTTMTAVAFALLGSIPAIAAAEAAAPAPQPSAQLDTALRFRNAAPIAVDPEPLLIERPAARSFDRSAYFFDAYLGQRTVRALDGGVAGRAQNVNALDEVPDSSWFENRIGVRDVAPAELHERPVAPPRAPYYVVGVKLGGMSLGIRVRDASGVAYLLKFDRPSDPDSETAADLVLQRLLWTVGYHTPEDSLVRFRAADLRLDPKASMKNQLGASRPMTAADLSDILAKVGRRPDGTYRGLMSRFVPGVPVGGYPQEGVRADDPNDRVPHQDRREVRGARVFFSWLNQVDVKEDNVLDTWIEDPASPGRGRLRHYLVDFGNSMGVYDWKVDPSVGYAQLFDASYGARSLVSFGLWKRPWDGVQSSTLPGVGNLESQRFDPVAWRPQYPWAPFERFDRFDGAWGARLLMRVTPAHVAAAVAEGQYSDPRSAAYITRTLVERQRKIGRHYLAATSPLERFGISEAGSSAALCFDDPLLAHFGADEPQLLATTRHRIVTWDFGGRPLPSRMTVAGAAQVCVDGIKLGAERDGYTIVDIQTTRSGAGTPLGRVLVYVAREPQSQRPRVIGVRRL